MLIICKENHNFHLNYTPPGFWEHPLDFQNPPMDFPKILNTPLGSQEYPPGFSPPWVFKIPLGFQNPGGYLCWPPLDFGEYHPGLSKIPLWIFKILQNPWGDFAKFYIFAEKLSIFSTSKDCMILAKFVTNLAKSLKWRYVASFWSEMADFGTSIVLLDLRKTFESIFKIYMKTQII